MTPEVRKLLERARAWLGQRPTPMELADLRQLRADISAALEGREGEGDEAERLRAENARLREALRFYGDPATYHGCGFVADRTAGDFIDDFDDDHGDETYQREMPGKRARAALKEEGDPMTTEDLRAAREAVLHAVHRNHVYSPMACDGCANVERFMAEPTGGEAVEPYACQQCVRLRAENEELKGILGNVRDFHAGHDIDCGCRGCELYEEADRVLGPKETP